MSEIFVDDSSVSIDSQNADTEGNLDVTSDITQPDENEVISGTLSSPDISDHEAQTEDMSHDDSADHIVVRERRDSGVGSSLTRTNRYANFLTFKEKKISDGKENKIHVLSVVICLSLK